MATDHHCNQWAFHCNQLLQFYCCYLLCKHQLECMGLCFSLLKGKQQPWNILAIPSNFLFSSPNSCNYSSHKVKWLWLLHEAYLKFVWWFEFDVTFPLSVISSSFSRSCKDILSLETSDPFILISCKTCRFNGRMIFYPQLAVADCQFQNKMGCSQNDTFASLSCHSWELSQTHHNSEGTDYKDIHEDGKKVFLVFLRVISKIPFQNPLACHVTLVNTRWQKCPHKA